MILTSEEKEFKFIVIAGNDETRSYTQNPGDIEAIISMLKGILEKREVEIKVYKNEGGVVELIDTIQHHAAEDHEHCPACHCIMEFDKNLGLSICPECDHRADE
jgi:hypothetical protein